jgi:hypothetical protein
VRGKAEEAMDGEDAGEDDGKLVETERGEAGEGWKPAKAKAEPFWKRLLFRTFGGLGREVSLLREKSCALSLREERESGGS